MSRPFRSPARAANRPRRLVRAAVVLALAAASAAAAPAVARARTIPPLPPLTANQDAATWGANTYGQLGDGNYFTSALPATISGITNFKQISDGINYALAVTTSGLVYGWGANGVGQLGTGDKQSYPAPQQVASLTGVTQVAAGWNHSLALRSDGTVWAWGDNAAGELGNGGTAASLTPEPVPGLTGVVQIAAGNEWSLALRSDGTVWGWGGNQWGQLGVASPTAIAAPVQIHGLSEVTSIAAGAFFGMAVERHGFVAIRNYVYTWGQDTDGTIGNGGACLCGYLIPAEVTGINVPEVESIAAGQETAYAVGTDGTVWDWGDNAFGQLGIGNTSFKLTPVNVEGLAGSVTQIAAGANHAVALLANGTVQAWGYDKYGQLGNGQVSTDQLYPVTVTGLTGATSVTAGADNSMAIHTVWVFR